MQNMQGAMAPTSCHTAAVSSLWEQDTQEGDDTMTPLEAYAWFATFLGLLLLSIALVGWRVGR